ncbi:MAG: hypothetical protein ACHP84_20950, partial [Caulobacterales bacterium]
MHLDDPSKHVTLWSGDAEGPANQGAQLQAELANTIVGILTCSNRALAPAHGLTDPALLTRYLHACDIIANGDFAVEPHNNLELLSSLRAVTVGAPDFALAHSDLAMFGAALAPTFPPDQADPLRREAATEAARALSLDPKSADAYVAQAFLLPPDRWADRERLMRAGVAADPAWPFANGFLATQLSETGRLHEATQAAEKAASTDLNIGWGEDASFMAGMDGQAGRCVDDVGRFLKLAPKSS